MSETKKSARDYLRLSGLSALVGVGAGVSATVFIVLLKFTAEIRDADRRWIYLLPVAGFLVGWIYHRHAREAERGNNLILDEIHDPRNTLPFRMAPLVLLGTLVTNLFGGSAGREGAAVQTSASLAEQIARFFKVSPGERRTLLVAGMGAGFGAAIAAPWAGVIFGLEVIAVGRLRAFALLECAIASFVGFYVTHLLRASHLTYPTVAVPEFRITLVGAVLVAGIAFGLAAIFFMQSAHFIEKLQKRFIPYAPLRPLLGGLVLVGLYYWEGSFRFTGLGFPVIQSALASPTSLFDPIYKGIATAITIGSGFKGGEFVPLVFMGTTLGSALSVILPGGTAFLGALGFAAVFGAAANTPLACTVMAMELFGVGIGPYALVATWIAFQMTRELRLYSSQKVERSKLRWFFGF